MPRLLKDRLQQHSTPSVLLYDQIESVTLVDAKWTQGVQTPNPVALTEFPGRIWPLLVVFKAADRGITQEVMICGMKMFCCWWSFKPTVSPVVTMAIHTFVQWAFGFSYVLFVATAARDQIHNILCCAVCVLSQSYSGPRRWLHSASRELLDSASEHPVSIWHQQGWLTLSGHIVEHLVCCVVVDDLLEA